MLFTISNFTFTYLFKDAMEVYTDFTKKGPDFHFRTSRLNLIFVAKPLFSKPKK